MYESLEIDEFPYECSDVGGQKQKKILKLKFPEIDPNNLPMVSILTPTRNRRKFQDLMKLNWGRIDYPRSKLEWVILDDSDPGKGIETEKFQKLGSNVRIIKIPLNKKNKACSIGRKRNLVASFAKGEIFVHMDDDDYYPPESVIARVKALLCSKDKECTGCTKTLCYDIIHDQTFEAYDQSSNDSTKACTISESTFAYTKQFWESHNFNNDDTYSEGLNFIKGRHNQIIILPYIFVITQFSHTQNTIQRQTMKCTHHTSQFIDKVSFIDKLTIEKLKINLLMENPIWKKALEFIKVNSSKTKKQFIKKLERQENKDIRINPFLIQQYQYNYITKKRSSGKDLVYYCGPGQYFKFNNSWNGKSKGLGGSEEAVVNLSEKFVDLGYSVTVYNTTQNDVIHNDVKYLPYWKWIPQDFQDITILWRDPGILDIEINSKKIFLDLHDDINPLWIYSNPDRLKNVDYIMCKSEFHRKKLISNQNYKFKVIPNGIHSKNFQKVKRNENKNENKKILCTSSPDRCIRALLHALPLIREEIPGTEIYWAYGFKSGINKGGMEMHPDIRVREWVIETKKLISETKGFHDLGRLNHSQISQLCMECDIYAYGTIFPEIDCISLTKSMAGGAIPVVTSTAALRYKLNKYCKSVISYTPIEIIQNGTNQALDSSLYNSDIRSLYFEKWVNQIIKQLKYTNNNMKFRIQIMRRQVQIDYDWKNISKQWNQFIL